MKARLFGNPNRGVSTLEILIAITILTLSIVAVIMIVMGNQSIAVDTQTNIEAIGKAEAQLEAARALSRQSFSSVVTIPQYPWAPPGGLTYYASTTVSDLTQCKKQATSTVTWSDQGRPQKIELSTFLTDMIGFHLLGGDCEANIAFGNWSPPLERSGLNIDKATGLDVEYKLAFLTLNKTPNSSDDLAIVDVTSSTSPMIISHVDVKKEPGFNAIDVATSTNGHLYAYIANNNPIGQLLIMDVTNAAAPTFVASSTLPGISTGVGRSIYYYNKKIYIGTSYFVCGGCHELHIYDVTTPSSPVHIDSIDVNRNVNSISVRDGLAYLATGPGSAGVFNPLKIFDVDSASPTYKQLRGSFVATGNEEGTSLFLLGRKLFLGLEHASSGRPDFFILDVTTPSALVKLASKNLAMNSTSAVVGVRVSGNLGFIGASDPNENLMILDISKTTLPLLGKFNFAQTTTGMDMADNTIYLSSFSGSRSLEIVGPSP